MKSLRSLSLLLTFVLCQLLAATAAYAVDACTNISGVPQFDSTTNGTITTTLTTPYIPKIGVYTWGTAATTGPCPGANATPPGPWSAGFACQLLANGFGGGSTGSLSVAPGFDPTGILLCTINYPPDPTYHPTGYVYAGQCNTNLTCPTGFTPNGNVCQLTTAVNFDAQSLAHNGSTVTRNLDGNITNIAGGDFANFSVTSFDSLKRATQIVIPNGTTVSYTYVGDTASIATISDSNGTTSFGYLDPLHISSVTLPDGTIYNLGHGTDSNGNKFLNSVGVVHGFVGGTRAGTLAPWGVAIPFVTSSLETPNDKMLALLLEGLEMPGFHAEPVGVQPYASALANGENNTLGDFTIAYADSVAHATNQVYPPVLPGSPMPSSCVIAGAGGNQNPYCIMWHGIAMGACIRGPNSQFYACVNNVWQAYRAMGC